MNKINHKIGDTVYLKTDPDQLERIVTGMDIRQSGIMYFLSQSTVETPHYDFEISTKKDILKTSTN